MGSANASTVLAPIKKPIFIQIYSGVRRYNVTRIFYLIISRSNSQLTFHYKHFFSCSTKVTLKDYPKLKSDLVVTFGATEIKDWDGTEKPGVGKLVSLFYNNFLKLFGLTSKSSMFCIKRWLKKYYNSQMQYSVKLWQHSLQLVHFNRDIKRKMHPCSVPRPTPSGNWRLPSSTTKYFSIEFGIAPKGWTRIWIHRPTRLNMQSVAGVLVHWTQPFPRHEFEFIWHKS